MAFKQWQQNRLSYLLFWECFLCSFETVIFTSRHNKIVSVAVFFFSSHFALQFDARRVTHLKQNSFETCIPFLLDWKKNNQKDLRCLAVWLPTLNKNHLRIFELKFKAYKSSFRCLAIFLFLCCNTNHPVIFCRNANETIPLKDNVMWFRTWNFDRIKAVTHHKL